MLPPEIILLILGEGDLLGGLFGSIPVLELRLVGVVVIAELVVVGPEVFGLVVHLDLILLVFVDVLRLCVLI